MTGRIKVALAAASVFVLQAPALADGHESAPNFTMVHVRTCDFNAGQGMAEFNRVVRDWNRWADRQNITDYMAIAMMPNFHGADTFDLGWMGLASSAASLGSALDTYGSEGGEFIERFAEVVTCNTHGMFASSVVKPPSQPAPPDNVVIVFRDCKIADGVTYDELADAHAKWGAYMSDNGYSHGEWMWWPVFGGGGAEFDYKLVQGFPNHEAVGSMLELFGNGGGWRTHQELVGALAQCDDGRVYDGAVQRRMAAGE